MKNPLWLEILIGELWVIMMWVLVQIARDPKKYEP